MSKLTAPELWRQLQAQGLVDGDRPAPDETISPWYVRLMLGIAGWIAALFLLGFVGAGFADVLDDALASLVLGLFGCAAAYALFRCTGHNDFGQQFAMALSISAQAVFAVGLYKSFKTEPSVLYFSLFAFDALLTLCLPNFIHRVLTSWWAMLALMLSLSSAGIYGFATGIAAAGFALIWINEWRWAAHDKLWRPIGYGLCLALLQLQAWYFFDLRLFLSNAGIEPGWLMLHAATVSTCLITLTLLLVVKRLLEQENFAPDSPVGILAFTAALLLGALSLAAPGVATSLLILLLGFASSNRILLGFGLLALGCFVSHYYYQLQDTLLFKSLILAFTGCALLILRLALLKYFPPGNIKESGNA